MTSNHQRASLTLAEVEQYVDVRERQRILAAALDAAEVRGRAEAGDVDPCCSVCAEIGGPHGVPATVSDAKVRDDRATRLDSFDVPATLSADADWPSTLLGADREAGIWVAFNWDGSAFVPFATEIDALRHALSYSMTVRFVRFGDDEWMRK